MVSHEIRTPLNAVNGATAMLLDTVPLTSEQRELLALLDAGANHVVLIVEDSARPACICAHGLSVRALTDARACGACARGSLAARRAEQRPVPHCQRAADAGFERAGAGMVHGLLSAPSA